MRITITNVKIARILQTWKKAIRYKWYRNENSLFLVFIDKGGVKKDFGWKICGLWSICKKFLSVDEWKWYSGRLIQQKQSTIVPLMICNCLQNKIVKCNTVQNLIHFSTEDSSGCGPAAQQLSSYTQRTEHRIHWQLKDNSVPFPRKKASSSYLFMDFKKT